MASLRPTRWLASRVLWNCIGQSPTTRAPARSIADDPAVGLRARAARRPATMAVAHASRHRPRPPRRTPSARRRRSSRRARRPRARPACTSAKPGNQHLPLRLDHDVEQRLADQREVVAEAAGEEARQVGLLPDHVGQRHGLAQDRARLARRQHHVRMHQHAADGLGHRDLLDERIVDADGQHQPAEQRRRDVVDVHRAAGHGLALHRELEQFGACAAVRRPAPRPRPRPPRPRPPTRRARSRAECPSRSRARSRTAARARGTAPAPPCRRCSSRPRAAGLDHARDRADGDARLGPPRSRARGRRARRRSGRGCRSRRRRCRRSPARRQWPRRAARRRHSLAPR